MRRDHPFWRTKIRPLKQRQAQINRRAVERINGLGEIKFDIVIDVQFVRTADYNGGYASLDASVSTLMATANGDLSTDSCNLMPSNFAACAPRQAAISDSLLRCRATCKPVRSVALACRRPALS